jgi:hypothetical protein
MDITSAAGTEDQGSKLTSHNVCVLKKRNKGVGPNLKKGHGMKLHTLV